MLGVPSSIFKLTSKHILPYQPYPLCLSSSNSFKNNHLAALNLHVNFFFKTDQLIFLTSQNLQNSTFLEYYNTNVHPSSLLFRFDMRFNILYLSKDP